MITYWLQATALCPMDGSRDFYEVEIASASMLHAEDLRRFFETYANREMYQEQLAVAAREAFPGCEITLTGDHPASVRVIVT